MVEQRYIPWVYIPYAADRSVPIACCMGTLLTLAAQTAFAADLTIFAAASLKEVLDEANIN
jgi:ABC-type molybdate transport system substrate-binding protein